MVFYSYGWTPLQSLYPTECLPYEVRAKGLALVGWAQNVVSLINTFGLPSALAKIGWKSESLQRTTSANSQPISSLDASMLSVSSSSGSSWLRRSNFRSRSLTTSSHLDRRRLWLRPSTDVRRRRPRSASMQRSQMRSCIVLYAVVVFLSRLARVHKFITGPCLSQSALPVLLGSGPLPCDRRIAGSLVVARIADQQPQARQA